MSEIFLTVFNMSITASYVIVAVFIIRLLLKKAPKKWSYLLWSVVGFRLCCPVSFESAASIFSLKLFDMSTAQRSGGAALHYVPENIGLMAQPSVTTGIPSTNAAIQSALPAATPAASVNPMQIWIAAATAVWCIGIAALLIYSAVTYLRLHRQMATAVLLEENVWQSDQLRSPFVLGFFKPRIYIPFGLNESTKRYVLAHEQYHIQRFDHIVKPAAFLLLVIHWFNPLCWIAFLLMTRDMEMSCDEKVLSAEENSEKAYSTSLLSFAANRRFPVPTPLAFGESGVKSRIKNALSWKQPKRWITITAVLLCITAVAVCAANPKSEGGKFDLLYPDGVYNFDEVIYQNPLSSYYPVGGTGYRYQFSGNTFSIVEEETGELFQSFEELDWNWQAVTEEQWMDWFLIEALVPDISSYQNPLRLELSSSYNLFSMDGALWLAAYHGEKESADIWSIYALKKESSSVIGVGGANNFERSISAAILEHGKSGSAQDGFSCASYVVLATGAGGPAGGSKIDTATAYVMALYQEYDFSDGVISEVAGSHTPVALTFSINNLGECVLEEYFTPRDGDDTKADIEMRFPEGIQESALHPQNYILMQKQDCYAQAVEYANLDTDAVVASLFEKIMSSPAEASNPDSYVSAHPDEYRELTYYGDATLRYVYREFLKGGQTGLKGQMMRMVMDELSGQPLEIAASTGQDYFDAWLAWGKGMLAQNGETYMKSNMPKVFMLLEMLEK